MGIIHHLVIQILPRIVHIQIRTLNKRMSVKNITTFVMLLSSHQALLLCLQERPLIWYLLVLIISIDKLRYMQFF
jgi:hypothetical protein